MKQSTRLATLAIASAALAPAWAAEPYTLWDNFNGSDSIQETRWQGPVERIRLIEAGTLNIGQRDVGGQSNNFGLLSSDWNTELKNSTSIKQMRASVVVTDFSVDICAANPTASTVEARLVGLFFNAGPGVPTNLVNDVGAVIRLLRSSASTAAANVLQVQGVVFQCTTADCNSGSIALGVADLGTATLGETVVLKMEWDQVQKRFNFYRGSNPVVPVPYVVNDSQASTSAFRAIGTRTSLANCFSGSRVDAFIDSKFDRVSVNASSAP